MAVSFTRRALKSARKIDKSDSRIAKSMHRRFKELSQDPAPAFAKPMKGFPDGTRIVPFAGDYGRIVYYATPGNTLIIAVGPRENMYQDWQNILKELLSRTLEE